MTVTFPRFTLRKTHKCGCVTVWDWKYDKSRFEIVCDDHDPDVDDKDRLD